MAYPTVTLVNALIETARRLKDGNHYAWGNHGSCNCGNLLQVLTPFTKNDILKIAQTGIGEWTELAEEYCEVTNLPVHDLLGALQRAGLTPVDIHNIEYLEDRKVLEALPGGFRWLKRNLREDVIVYLETFAMLLQKDLDKRTGDIINQALEQQEIPVAANESISLGIVREVVNA
jgi:hypothetical protein